MAPSKRIFDLALGVALGLLLLPVIGLVSAAILLRDGRPVLFGHVRTSAPGTTFTLWKFRTMTNSRRQPDRGVSGGHKKRRITRFGRFLRRTRLDELPQLWNVIRGDMSFVGPRPPDPRYVAMFPDLYAEVLKSRPGVTGLATLAYHRTEERLLAQCRTAKQTEMVYISRCIPRKARLDLIYAQNRTLCYDILLILHTAFRRLPLHLRR
jgi:lipopolysaccharide/colanic/teichoic acid biosynthesis glycosyltransferase